MRARVLIVDDHELFLQGLESLLQGEPNYEVIAKAGDGRSAIEKARETEPDVVLMDLSMPEMNGIEATRLLRSEFPSVRVICLSMHTEERFVNAVIEAGASGYLVKDCDSGELARALDAVMMGRVYLSPAVAGIVVEGYRSGKSPQNDSFERLSAREREVLQLLAEGYGTPAIADKLGVSTKTIGTHRSNIMAKLNIRSIAGLTKYAVRHGLSDLGRHRTP